MSRKCAWTDSLLGNACKRRLESRNKLCFQLTFNLISVILLFKVSADICIEKKGIGDSVRINTAAAYGNINVQTDILVYYTERNRVRSTKFIINQLFGIEVVNTLVFARISTEGETLANSLECL